MNGICTNGIRSTAVHQDASSQARTRLEVAIRVAKANDAEVTALYAVSSIYAQFPFAVVSSPDAAAVLCDIEDASLAKARASFEIATRDCGVKIGWLAWPRRRSAHSPDRADVRISLCSVSAILKAARPPSCFPISSSRGRSSGR